MKVAPFSAYAPWEVKTEWKSRTWLVREKEVFDGYRARNIATGEELFLYLSRKTL